MWMATFFGTVPVTSIVGVATAPVQLAIRVRLSPSSTTPFLFSHGGTLRSLFCSQFAAGLYLKRWPTRRYFASLVGTNEVNDFGDTQQTKNEKYQDLMDASTLSLAPMMEYTDRHFRHLVRLISTRTLLYTEMVPANALAHERRNSIEEAVIAIKSKDRYSSSGADSQSELVDGADVEYSDLFLRRYLAQGQSAKEGPSVLQLGGSDPQQMFEAAETVMDMTRRGHCDYTALNLNCGCPSPKVAGKGCFGAALMEEANQVAALTRALHHGTNGQLPVTVKCRIGTDLHHAFSKLGPQPNPQQEYDRLCRFIETVAADGVVTDFSVHARIAVLQKSFSPADNRKVPPLRYDVIRRLIGDFPSLTFTLNGGINNIAQAQAELTAAPGLNGIMIGRGWAADPWSFAMADQLLYGEKKSPFKNRLQILEAYGRHADMEEEGGEPNKIRRFIVKAVSPLFTGEANAKRYRIALDEIAGLPKRLKREGKSLAGQPPLSELIMSAAMAHLSTETLMRSPEESYDRLLCVESRLTDDGIGRSASIQEWQSYRNDEASLGSGVLENAAVG